MVEYKPNRDPLQFFNLSQPLSGHREPSCYRLAPALPSCGCIKYLKETRDLFFPIPAVLYFFASVKKITLHSNEGTGPHEI